MSAYIVTYDLHKEGQNYNCLHEKLKTYGAYWHMQGSVWLIKTSQTAAQVRDYLSPCLDHNDKLMVAELSGQAAWIGYSNDATKWLKESLFAAA